MNVLILFSGERDTDNRLHVAAVTELTAALGFPPPDVSYDRYNLIIPTGRSISIWRFVSKPTFERYKISSGGTLMYAAVTPVQAAALSAITAARAPAFKWITLITDSATKAELDELRTLCRTPSARAEVGQRLNKH